jgi:hypothetical protein
MLEGLKLKAENLARQCAALAPKEDGTCPVMKAVRD